MDGIEAPADQHFSYSDSLKWFIQPNNLECRWSNLGSQSRLFTLGETHFGCGSNFLHSAALWQASAPSSARLHYVAAHPAPLTRELSYGWRALETAGQINRRRHS